MPIGSATSGQSSISPSNALAELAKIRAQVEALQKEQQNKSNDPSRKDFKGGPPTVTPGRTLREFVKYTNDTKLDAIWTARDIGLLVKDNSRLNVITALREGDTADHFRFRVHRSGEMRLGQIVTGGEKDKDGAGEADLRIQLMDRRGRVVADSAAREGSRERVAFENLREGALSVGSGDYILKVTRTAGELPQHAKTTVNYGLQLTMGTYHNDYDTIERAAPKNENPFALPIRSQAVIDTLSAGIGFIASLPPRGQNGAQKLVGHFINRLF